jgi:hypothetical protein
MVIQIQFNPSGYKFANYGNWTKSWDLLQFDWLRYMAWNYQSSKTKELTSFLYTSTILLYTQTVGFVTLVSPLCDGRSHQSVSHLLPLTKRKAQERESTPYPGGLTAYGTPLPVRVI